MKHLLITTLSLLVLSLSAAHARHSYYPEEFQQIFKNADSQTPEQLRRDVHKVLTTPHFKRKNAPDLLGCNHSNDLGKCYRQEAVGYSKARKLLFGEIHLERNEDGSYFVKDIYCLEKLGSRYGIGPGKVPNHNVVNTEHVWPQSKFSRRFPTNIQKSDLHHLYPTNSQANSTRSSNPFGDVDGGQLKNCPASSSGRDPSLSRSHAFEPPDEYKGNIARALFYFSVRYDLPLSSAEREILVRWNDLDPVDEFEHERNDMIYEAQGNRNPFIDYPELAASVF